MTCTDRSKRPAYLDWPVVTVEVLRQRSQRELDNDRWSADVRAVMDAGWSGEEAIRDWQAGRCAVCGRKAGARLVVDHDHETGLIRGMLCCSCNTLEGKRSVGFDFDAYRANPPAAVLGVREAYYSIRTGYAVPESDRAESDRAGSASSTAAASSKGEDVRVEEGSTSGKVLLPDIEKAHGRGGR